MISLRSGLLVSLIVAFTMVGTFSSSAAPDAAPGATAAAPAITTTPDKFGSGQTVTVNGTGFSPNTTVNVWFDANHNTNHDANERSAVANTDGAGSFSGVRFMVESPVGTYSILATTAAGELAASPIAITSCLFTDCFIDGRDTICILGYSPKELISDCKVLDASYTDPTSYNFANIGPQFLGARVLAAATNDLGLAPLVPLNACPTMTAALGLAEGTYGNVVPARDDLILVACNPFFVEDLAGLITFQVAAGHGGDEAIKDARILLALLPEIEAAAALAGPVGMVAVQQAFASAAVAGAIACGYVNYYCNGKDITGNLLLHNELQTRAVPMPFLHRWGDIIGWSKVTCLDNTAPPQNADHSYQETATCKKTMPGTAGPLNTLADNGHGAGIGVPVCATGKVTGMSIGYDGDISFDLNDGLYDAAGILDPHKPGPLVAPFTNFYNFLPAGDLPAPDGLDIEVPTTDHHLFPVLDTFRIGLNVRVCGRFVADMHQSWNELHPVTSIDIIAASSTAVSSSLNPSMYGQPVTYTATPTRVGLGTATPTGTVQFAVDGTNLGAPAPLVGGTATSLSVNASAGAHSITALYTGDNTMGGSRGVLTQTVTGAPLTIAAGDQTKVYGAVLPALSVTYVGFVNGDTPAVFVDPFTQTTTIFTATTATVASHVSGSPYPITVTGGGGSNYVVTFVPGSLTVTTAPLTISADDQTKLYGAALPQLTASFSGLVNGDTAAALSTPPTLVSTATASSHVAGSPYPIIASGAVATDYAISYLPGSLSMTPAPLTITADNQTKSYGAALPALTVSYFGFVNGDTSASLAAQPTVSTTATVASHVGSYPITATGAADPDYAISSIAGTLTVIRADQTITFGALVDKILGEAPFATVATASSGLPVTFMASGSCTVSGSTVALSATGTCTITVSQPGSGDFNTAPNVSRSFTVLSPAQLAQQMAAMVSNMGLPTGTARSLTSKLQAIAASTDRGNNLAACGQLGAFLNSVNAQSAKQIPAADAALLREGAARLRAALHCD